MITHKRRRGTSLLVMLQAWILPCHGFTYAPYALGSSQAGSQQAARQLPLPALQQQQPRPLRATAAVSRSTLTSLSLSDEPGAFGDPFADEVRF